MKKYKKKITGILSAAGVAHGASAREAHPSTHEHDRESYELVEAHAESVKAVGRSASRGFPWF